MDISSVLTALARRWYVALLVLGLSGYAAYGTWQDSQPVFTGTTTLTVLPSTSLVSVRAAANAGESSLANPFGVNATPLLGSLLMDQINNNAVILDEAAVGSAVAADSSATDSTSFFTVTILSSTPEGVVQGLDDVAQQAPQLLAVIQTSAGAPSDQLYTSYRTRPDVEINADYPDRLRSSVGLVLAGLLLATLLCVVIDSCVVAVQRRRGRARARRQYDQQAAETQSATQHRDTGPLPVVRGDGPPPPANESQTD